MFEEVRVLLDAVAATAPLLVVLEDLHWADAPTLLLLRSLLRISSPSPRAIVGTYRELDLGRTHPLADLLSDLRRDRSATRVPLSHDSMA